MAALPFERSKLQKLKIEKSPDEPWGFTLQTFGLRLQNDANAVHFITYVDYVEMFSKSYDAGLRQGDIIIGFGIDDQEETFATPLQNVRATVIAEMDSLSKSSKRDPVEVTASSINKSFSSTSSDSSDPNLVRNRDSVIKGGESHVSNPLFADHDWICSELRRAQRMLSLRIVREDCVGKLHLFQRRIKLRSVLAVKRQELDNIEAELDAKTKKSRESSRVNSKLSDSEQQSAAFVFEAEPRVQRPSVLNLPSFLDVVRRRHVSRDESISSTYSSHTSSGIQATIIEAIRESATAISPRRRISAYAYAGSNCSEYDRAMRLRSLALNSVDTVGVRLHIDALAQRERDMQSMDEKPRSPTRPSFPLSSFVLSEDTENEAVKSEEASEDSSVTKSQDHRRHDRKKTVALLHSLTESDL